MAKSEEPHVIQQRIIQDNVEKLRDHVKNPESGVPYRQRLRIGTWLTAIGNQLTRASTLFRDHLSKETSRASQDAQSTTEQRIGSEVRDALARQAAEHAQQLKEQEDIHQQAMNEQQELHEGAFEKLKRTHGQEKEKIADQHRRELDATREKERENHTQATEELQRLHEEQIESTRNLLDQEKQVHVATKAELEVKKQESERLKKTIEEKGLAQPPQDQLNQMLQERYGIAALPANAVFSYKPGRFSKAIQLNPSDESDARKIVSTLIHHETIGKPLGFLDIFHLDSSRHAETLETLYKTGFGQNLPGIAVTGKGGGHTLTPEQLKAQPKVAGIIRREMEKQWKRNPTLKINELDVFNKGIDASKLATTPFYKKFGWALTGLAAGGVLLGGLLTTRPKAPVNTQKPLKASAVDLIAQSSVITAWNAYKNHSTGLDAGINAKALARVILRHRHNNLDPLTDERDATALANRVAMSILSTRDDLIRKGKMKWTINGRTVTKMTQERPDAQADTAHNIGQLLNATGLKQYGQAIQQDYKEEMGWTQEWPGPKTGGIARTWRRANERKREKEEAKSSRQNAERPGFRFWRKA